MRRSLLSRVGELLTRHAVIWLIGFAVGVTFLLGRSLIGPITSVLVAIVLVVVSATVFAFKDRVMILGRRIMFTRQRVSRRQFLATTLSITITGALSAAFGWMLGKYILGSYDEQVRRYLTRKPKK